MKRILIIAGLLIGNALASETGQQAGEPSSVFPAGWVFKVPALDIPFNFSNGYQIPSMYQTLYACKQIAQTVHWTIPSLVKFDSPWLNRFVTTAGIALFDIFYLWLPPGYIWLHEEYHRAVMTNRGISSFDDVYYFQIFAQSVAVSHVDDDDLVRLKADYPADMVRLHSAGIEAEQELVLTMQQDCFFTGKTPYYDQLSWWMEIVNPIAYVRMCSLPVADTSTAEQIAEDGTDVEVRDFTGLDFTAWVYDLYRPDEPYEARGAHPTGVGIDRYIRYSDLTSQELSFLKLQGWLSMINLASPFMLGFHRFQAINPFNSRPMFWNLSAGHRLTSFGYSLDANVFLKQDDFNFFLIFHNYVSPTRYFPGVDVSLYRYPLKIGNLTLSISPRIALWLQPVNERADDTRAAPGGLLDLEVSLPLAKHLELFLATCAKTQGWVANNVHLNPAVDLSLGLNIYD